MSLCSCSSCLTIPSSSSSKCKWSGSSDSYRLTSSSSITTVSTLSNNFPQGQDCISEDGADNGQQWVFATAKRAQNCHIEKNVSLQDQPDKKNSCILKAIMTQKQIVISDSSTTRSTIIPNKHLSMKVIFHV
ncbi:unnamed protein product [Adineta ricciae]|uniref:Uncharacterized protein n=1 Tax=Adineta ricciae TaxID=249248 RepID=A0A814A740_ADIRI|nr:unnamed protein product [Adineta ricciae]